MRDQGSENQWLASKGAAVGSNTINAKLVPETLRWPRNTTSDWQESFASLRNS